MRVKDLEYTPDDDTLASTQSEGDAGTSNKQEIEKGSGYGPPNTGSGETVSQDDVSPDGQLYEQRNNLLSGL